MLECFSTNPIELTLEYKTIISSFVLTMVVLGFSIFASIYSNFIHNLRMAEVNRYLYEHLADITSVQQEANIYQDIAGKWREREDAFRYGAKLRAYSSIFCLWSLIFLIFTFIVIFLNLIQPLLWIILLAISLVLLILAPLIYLFDWDWSWIKKAPHILRGGIEPEH